MSFPIKPLNGTIVLEPVVIEEQTKGGVILPSTVSFHDGTKRHREATVLAVGPGTLLPDSSRLPVGISVGDRVLFDATSGLEYSREGKVFCTLVTQQSVVAVLPPVENEAQ